MRIPRIYHPSTLLNLNSSITLHDNAARHVGLVLRLAVKDKLILFNGDSCDYLAEICDIQKNKKSLEINVDIVDKKQNPTESVLQLHLGQAVLRGDKMDWVIQKAVELGVNDITPVITRYCNADKVTEKKLAHWQGIIISACEQCGRSRLPNLHPAMTLSAWLALSQYGLVFDPLADLTLKDIIIPENLPVYMLIGPEGGLSPAEIALSQQQRFQPVKMGNRILRTETAALSALSALQALFGDFSLP